MVHESPNKRRRNYTSAPFEIFIATLTLLPFILLAYFYSDLSDRVPLFMKLNGEVAVWGEKSVLSVFRVPLMGVVFQVVFLLMKSGSAQFKASDPLIQERQLSFSAGMWDWFRWAAAFKMSSESVETIFLSISRYNFLARPAFVVSIIATLIGVVGALLYLYRLLVVTREMKQQGVVVEKPRVNFRNFRVWLLVVCAITYLLLVFVPE